MTAIKIIAASLAAMASLGSAAASAAEFESNGRSVEVRYRDLDLSSRSGQRALNYRINRAAQQVCSGQEVSSMEKKCQKLAVAHVRRSVELAVAKAAPKSGQSERLAAMGKEKPAGAGD